MNLRMASRAKREHQVHDRLAGYPVVNDDGPFVATGGVTHTTAVTIALPSEVFLILLLQRVAGQIQAKRGDLGVSAGAMLSSKFRLKAGPSMCTGSLPFRLRHVEHLRAQQGVCRNRSGQR